jgi:hypothetical protein
VSGKRKWLAVFLVWLATDLGCIAFAHPQAWLYELGVRGLVIDFVLGIVVLALYVVESEQ